MGKKPLHMEPSLIVLAGLPLSGKTELGQAIVGSTDAAFFDIDKTRQEISPGNEWLGPEKEKEIMLAAYKRNHEKAEETLTVGKAVILAATYSRDTYHEMAQEVAAKAGVALYFFVLKVSEMEVEKRIEVRKQSGADSNITDIESYVEVRDRYSQPPNAETIDGTLPVDENVQKVIAKLRM